MYAGAVFAVIGVAAWLAAFRLSGFGAALLAGRAIDWTEDLAGDARIGQRASTDQALARSADQ